MTTPKDLLRIGAGASTLAIAVFCATPVLAQDSEDAVTGESGQDMLADGPLPVEPDETATIIVTGSNISGVKPVGSETLVVDRADIEATGLTDLHQVLQTLPQVQNNPNAGGSGPVYRQGGTAGYGGNSTQGTAINLRGLGTSATLILVDGRRVVPSGAASTFTEAIQVPITAVERIEVVSDGNSAIYGSDAISGVVNYVLRKDFDGLEITARDTFDDYHNQWSVSATAGKVWGSGNLVVTYQHQHRDSFVSGESPYLRQDLRPLGGPDARAVDAAVAVSTPTLIVGGNGQPYSYYTVPSDAGPGVDFSDLTPGANLVDSSYYEDFFGEQTRDQLAVFFNQDVTSTLSVFVEGFYTNRETESGAYGNSRVGNTIIVCQGSPYYIANAPAGAATSREECGGGLGQQIAVDPITFFNGQNYTSNPTETYSITGGFEGRLPGAWSVEGYFTYGHDSTCGICNFDNNANGATLAQEIVAGNINPYTSSPLSDAQYATFIGDNTQFSDNTFYDAALKFDGPLFMLPAGDLRTAFGAELAYNRQHLVNGSNTAFPADPANDTYAITNDTAVDRSTASVFAELYIPVVGIDMGVPLMQELNVNAAIRYDDYSDFGETTNPKIGVTWDVNDSLALRGSWGTSFRAPALTDTNPQNFSAAFYGIPLTNNSGRGDIGFVYPGSSSAFVVIGANPDLKPETATTWSAGIDFHPVGSGFRFSATYYSVRYSNQIVGQNYGEFLANADNAALYDSYITAVNNPASCVNGDPSTYDPLLADFITNHPALYPVQIFGACSVNVILDGRSANAATTFQDGLDFQVNYAFATGFGDWTLGLNATKILNQTVETVEGSEEADVLDTYYYPVSLTGRGQIGWSLGRFSANLFVNYVGSYTNTLPLEGEPESEVPAWTTLDLGINYAIPMGEGPLGGLRLGVNVQNLTDEDPPLVLTEVGNSYGAYDPSNANILGRIISLQVTKQF